METDDLFDVFGADSSNILDDIDEDTMIKDTSKRRREDKENNSDDVDIVEKKSKKASEEEDHRMNEEIPNEMPVVTDSFETQAETEFVAAKVDAISGKADATAKDKKVVLAHQIRHQVALPPNYPYVPISEHVAPEKPARTYPFKLDPFQATAIASIERNESVLVAAHTSAGKTVVAEYAIASALKNKQRVIYTSPIKALSNQKYRDLLEEFGDVGLQTGDVTINPSASCLVMTTEILRSMMYRGSEHMREVAWVIFDEVHYMRDKERGVVWEETIILLPHKVRYVFLSATIPNAMQFANWICRIHNQPCHVVYTDFRPTPLQHYVFPAGSDGIHLCVDEKAQFREENFLTAMSKISGSGKENDRGRKGGKKDAKGQTDLFKIIKMIWSRNYQPVIVFSFSKRECESNALQISKLDFNSTEEKELVTTIYESAIASLKEDDRQLPQIQHIFPLLKRGIGIHHSGLLPILKEVIEILFQEGLIKVLFATETFSIGLNMPAKTVVFTNTHKFDGKEMRLLGSGEYIQMSGRAGRRGLDDRGIVIMMVSGNMNPDEARSLLLGQADPLNSAFHLKYNMILNLMRVEGISPEFILKQSFFQFQNNERLPELEKNLVQMEKDRDAISIENEEAYAEHFDITRQLKNYKSSYRKVVHHPDFIVPFLQAGRLARVVLDNGDDFGWGIIVQYTKKEKKFEENKEPRYFVDILLHCSNGSSSLVSNRETPKPCGQSEKGEMVVVPVDLSVFDGVSTVRLFLPKDLRNDDKRNALVNHLNEVKKRFPDGIPVLDPSKDLNITDEAFKNLMEKINVLEERLKNTLVSRESSNQQIQDNYSRYLEKHEIAEKMKDMKREIKQTTSIIQMEELKNRKRLLRRLNFTTQEDVIEQKGRVACEITAGDEIVLTELLFNNVFNDMTPEVIAALLSCFVFQEGSSSKEEIILKSELQAPYKLLIDTVKKVAKISIECKVSIEEDQYVASFQKTLMNVVYMWSQGAPFSEICKTTDAFEGSIIRSMRRLEELLRSMITCSKQIGNEVLEQKFRESIGLIKRDIVFAASLYL